MRSRIKPAATAEAKPRTFALHWGSGVIEEEATIADRYHRPAIQLLKFLDGEARGTHEIRFCYYDNHGRFQRSPLIVDEANLHELGAALKQTPRLRALLKRLIT
jgi:hypothetical protein